MAIDPNGRPELNLASAVGVLKAVAEPTRLRLLVLLAQGELNVKDLTRILGQSQPRISRHLKLLAEAGLVERAPEGSWVYFRLAEEGRGGEVARQVLQGVDQADPVLVRDRRRAEALQARAAGSGAGLLPGACGRLGQDPRAARGGSRRGGGRVGGAGRRPVRSAGRSRHRHGPHAGAVRAALPPRPRPRPQPGHAGLCARQARARRA